MLTPQAIQERTGFSGDIIPLLIRACTAYDLGEYKQHSFVLVGYEDCGIVLETTIGKFFVKVFASFRSPADCKRYVDILQAVIDAGVVHPRMFTTPQGVLYEDQAEGIAIRLCVMEYISGDSLYQRQATLSKEDIRFLTHQTARINQIPLQPDFLYDSWAESNFVKEYKKSEQYLSESEHVALQPLVRWFASDPLSSLPHAFVHGDIITTNILRDKNGKLFIIDFAVANFYPRIQELAVLFCNAFFNEYDLQHFPEVYDFVLKEYQSKIPLTKLELETLPRYVQAAHAMHVIRATYEQHAGENVPEENAYWLELGKIGLAYTKKLWE